MDDWIAILNGPIDVSAVVESVLHPEAGGVDVFLGCTRAEQREDGVELAALHYETYAEMAEAQLREIARRVKERWKVKRLALLHRTGPVKLAEASVVVATSCAHRSEAFESCRFIIDELKRVAAIWKKEVWADGKTTWVEGTPVK